MTTALFAQGTLLQIGDGGGPEVFTTIDEVVGISGPGMSRAALDASNHSSPDAWEEKIKGMKAGGEVTFELNFKPGEATHGVGTGLLADLEDNTKRNFKLIFTDAGNTEWILPAMVSSFEPSLNHDEKVSASVTLTLTGKPTLA